MAAHLVLLFIALIADRLIGDPDWLWRRVPHPVVGFGWLIGQADDRINTMDRSDKQRENLGFVVIAALMIGAGLFGAVLGGLADGLGGFGYFSEAVIVAVFLAQKSLADHVAAVAAGLRTDGLAGGRKAVARIVGRDPDALDEAGVNRAAIESLAENASDGVVAPAFWYAIFGLPGLLAYKMLNTADSMIGHKTERHRAFGRAAAQIDDLANWLPARLTAILILLMSDPGRFGERWAVVRRDAELHRSPNAGWPESAMAAVAGLALGGPRIYRDDVADEPFMNDAGRKDADADDIDKALGVFWRAMTGLTIMIGLLAVLLA